VTRRIPLALALAVATLVLASCLSPAINAEGYRGKVGHSAQKMAGIIGSALLVAQLDQQGKSISTFTDSVITDAERDAQSVLTALDSVQPPDQQSIELRDKADPILQQAASQLSDLRIAQRRNDRAAMAQTMGDLSHTLGDVQQLQDLS
jgi:hypothetical protein